MGWDNSSGSPYGGGAPKIAVLQYVEKPLKVVSDLEENGDWEGALAKYYDIIETMEIQMAVRVNDFAIKAYDLVPRTNDFSVKQGLSDERYESIADAVLKSDLGHTIVGQQNRTEFLLYRWEDIKARTAKMITQIQAELAN